MNSSDQYCGSALVASKSGFESGLDSAFLCQKGMTIKKKKKSCIIFFGALEEICITSDSDRVTVSPKNEDKIKKLRFFSGSKFSEYKFYFFALITLLVIL